MITRRSLLKSVAVGAAAVAAPATLLAQGGGRAQGAQTANAVEELTLQGNIKQSVSRWCFGNIPMDEFCRICKRLGMVGIDLVSENEWDVVNSHDLIVTMANGPSPSGIGHGFNRTQNHEGLINAFTRLIPIAAEKKVPNIICFSGNRGGGLTDEQGLENCVVGLIPLMPIAERYGVTLQMELLNSKRDHGGYQADKTPWAAEIVRRVGSPRLKLLYDIYHMQIMEGDIIDTIRRFRNEIGHYHTAGVPGRNELDDRQEKNYPAIMRAIRDLEGGPNGFVAHEFIPRDRARQLEVLRDAVLLCDV